MIANASFNGGFTRTMAIAPGSPAIDSGDPAGCRDETGATVTTDQRAAPRPFGAGCDLGAFEYGSLIFDDDFEGWVWKWLRSLPLP